MSGSEILVSSWDSYYFEVLLNLVVLTPTTSVEHITPLASPLLINDRQMRKRYH